MRRKRRIGHVRRPCDDPIAFWLGIIASLHDDQAASPCPGLLWTIVPDCRGCGAPMAGPRLDPLRRFLGAVQPVRNQRARHGRHAAGDDSGFAATLRCERITGGYYRRGFKTVLAWRRQVPRSAFRLVGQQDPLKIAAAFAPCSGIAAPILHGEFVGPRGPARLGSLAITDRVSRTRAQGLGSQGMAAQAGVYRVGGSIPVAGVLSSRAGPWTRL